MVGRLIGVLGVNGFWLCVFVFGGCEGVVVVGGGAAKKMMKEDESVVVSLDVKGELSAGESEGDEERRVGVVGGYRR